MQAINKRTHKRAERRLKAVRTRTHCGFGGEKAEEAGAREERASNALLRGPAFVCHLMEKSQTALVKGG